MSTLDFRSKFSLLLCLAVGAAGTAAAAESASAKRSAPAPTAVLHGSQAGSANPRDQESDAALAREREEERERGKGDSSFAEFVRRAGSAAGDENGEISNRSSWLWYRLTYPTGYLPADPWGRAAEHIERFVPDAEPWPLEGAPLLPPEARPLDAPIEPGLNTWVEFGPRPLDSTGTTNNAYQYGIVAGRANVIVSDPVNRGAGAGDRAWVGFASGGLWRIDGIRSVNCNVSPCDVSAVTATSMWDGQISSTLGVSAIEIDPSDASGNTLYVGTGDWQANDQFSAGILKTTDGGQNWTQLAPGVFTPYSNLVPPDQANGGCVGCTGNRWSNQNIRQIEVDPNNPLKILVGTRYDLYISHDGGLTWQICGFGNSPTNPEGTIGGYSSIHRVSGIYLDARTAPTKAYVAVGYQFTTATIVTPNDDTQANFDNGVYGFNMPASGCPVWPGGYTNYFDGLPGGTGTGSSATGRIELAGRVDSDNFLTLYAQMSNSSSGAVQGTYVMRPGAPGWPTAAGNAAVPDWRLLTGSGSTGYKTCANGASDTGQDWYDLYVRAHPTTDRLLYIGHIDAFRTQVTAGYLDLGLTTASNISNVYGTSCASYGKVHPDQHAFAFVEMIGDANYGKWIILANDGGLFLNTNEGDTTKWVSLARAAIGTNQFYAGQIGMDFGDLDDNGTRGNPLDGKQWLLGGMQDNGSASWDSSRPDTQWTARGKGGDGLWAAFDSLGGTLTAGYWITEYVEGALSCSSTGADGPFGPTSCAPNFTGESPDWSTPIVMDQFHCTNTQCKNVVVGGDSVWASTAYGAPSWTRLNTTVMPGTAGAGSIVSMAMAPSEPKAVLAGTDNGKWWWTETGFSGAACTHANRDTASFACTANGSATWRQIDSAGTVLPNRVVGGVTFDPTNHNIVYAAVAGFSEATPTTPGHIFRAVWNGSSFTIQNKTGNLPDVPAQSVAVNPYNPNQVFLGTFYGFYYTDDITVANPTWVRYMEGLPNAPIFHLTIDRGPFGNSTASTTLAAFTYGRGVYAIKLPGAGETFCITKPAAPTGVGATTPVDNAVQVSWSDSTTSGVVSYRVYRASSPGGPYTFVGSVADSSPGVGGSGTYQLSDTPLSGGSTFYYIVRALQGDCESLNSTEVFATVTGDCLLAPTFSGAQSISPLTGGQGCGLRVSWNAGASQCGGALTYSIYRSTTSGFAPAPANRIASCVSGTSFDDTTPPVDTTVYYVVRAEDGGVSGGGACNGGNTDANLAQPSGFASTSGTLALYSNDFSVSASDWTFVAFGGSGDSWQGIQACPAGSSINRFGGAGCSDDYGDNNFVGRQPGGSSGVAIPAGTTNASMTFQHRWNFELGNGGRYYDGALLAVALDASSTYTVVTAAALTGTTYNGDVYDGAQSCPPTGSAGLAVFGASSTNYAGNAMQSTTVNLNSVCNTILGGTPGCAGHNVKVAFVGVTDCGTTADGWFIDNVNITASGSACTAAPQPVQFLTATGKNQQVTAEWMAPSSGSYASTRLRSSTGAPPADPGAGTLLVNEAGSLNEKETYVHASGLVNGTPQFYSAFANAGVSGPFAARRSVSGLPQSTTGNWKWNFSTPASALAPPIQGRGIAIYAPSNDRAFYGLAVGSNGGIWKTNFLPAAMNGPAQSSPIVMLAAETGLSHDAAFVGSQDGYVYCFNAATGAGCTGWPAGGRSTGNFGIVQAQPMFDPVTKRVLFGTRNTAGANGFHALNVLTGATAWSYTNAVPQGGDGQAMGSVSGPALILGSQVVFTSRVRAGGSQHSVWALNFAAGSASFAWARDLGGIDAAPTHDFTLNRVIVGTNGGAIYSLFPASGSTDWSRTAFADGPVKSFVYYHSAIGRLYFSTNTKVWSIPSSGASGSDWSVSGLFSPTRPLLHFGTTRTYVGACNDAACASGRLIELDSANLWATPKTLDLAGVGGLGPVTIDRNQSPALLHAGSRTGRVVAVQVPLP